MAYNPYYYPQQYYSGSQTPYNAPNLPANAQQAQGGQITWVQGEAAAKAYPVAAGQSVLLMDSEDQIMYIKSTDTSGMPQPLRVFDYTERKAGGVAKVAAADEYVTKAEFDEYCKTINKTLHDIQGGEG